MTRRGTPILAAVLLIVAALGSTAPGAAAADSLDIGALQRAIAKDLAGIGVPVKVKCSTANASAKRVSCTARIEGQTAHFNVNISETMFAHWKRVEALLVIKKMKRSIERAYSTQEPESVFFPAKADCGLPADQVILVAKVGSSLTCTIKVLDVKAGKATVRVKSVDGAVTVTWK
jgi:hypothetical protein